MECFFRFVDLLTDTTSKVFFVLINTAVMMTSVLGNGIVMFVIITRQRLHQPTYYLLFSLALLDFIIALFGQSIYTTEIALKDYTSCVQMDSTQDFTFQDQLPILLHYVKSGVLHEHLYNFTCRGTFHCCNT